MRNTPSMRSGVGMRPQRYQHGRLRGHAQRLYSRGDGLRLRLISVHGQHRLILENDLIVVAVAIEMARHDPAIRPDVADLDVVPLPDALGKQKRPRQIIGAVASRTIEVEGLDAPAIHRLALSTEGPGRENPLAMSRIVERTEGAIVDVERVLAARVYLHDNGLSLSRQRPA